MAPRPILRQMRAAKPPLCMIVANTGQKSAIENKQQKNSLPRGARKGMFGSRRRSRTAGYLLLNSCLLSGCWTYTCVNFTFTAEEIAVFLPVFGSGKPSASRCIALYCEGEDNWP